MDILFVHNNFPAQFRNLAATLTLYPGIRVGAIGSRGSSDVERVRLQRYSLEATDVAETHPFARRFDLECRRAEQILYAATAFTKQGFAPKTVIAHCGWGETLPLREAFPHARIITYCEFYYRSQGQDVNFDPEFGSLGVDACVGLQLKNAATLLSVIESDDGIAPTLWQKSTYPAELQSKISVLHEGVDTGMATPGNTGSQRRAHACKRSAIDARYRGRDVRRAQFGASTRIPYLHARLTADPPPAA